MNNPTPAPLTDPYSAALQAGLPQQAPPAVDPQTPPPAAEMWAIVSQMGHVTFAGRVTEEERFGGKIGRCDVPLKEGGFATRYFTAASLYSLVPCTEEAARLRAGCGPAPVYPLALPARSSCNHCGNRLTEMEAMTHEGACNTCTRELASDDDEDLPPADPDESGHPI